MLMQVTLGVYHTLTFTEGRLVHIIIHNCYNICVSEVKSETVNVAVVRRPVSFSASSVLAAR